MKKQHSLHLRPQCSPIYLWPSLFPFKQPEHTHIHIHGKCTQITGNLKVNRKVLHTSVTRVKLMFLPRKQFTPLYSNQHPLLWVFSFIFVFHVFLLNGRHFTPQQTASHFPCSMTNVGRRLSHTVQTYFGCMCECYFLFFFGWGVMSS